MYAHSTSGQGRFFAAVNTRDAVAEASRVWHSTSHTSRGQILYPIQIKLVSLITTRGRRPYNMISKNCTMCEQLFPSRSYHGHFSSRKYITVSNVYCLYLHSQLGRERPRKPHDITHRAPPRSCQLLNNVRFVCIRAKA